MSRAELDQSAAIMADEFGVAATYTPLVGDAFEVTAIMRYGMEIISEGVAATERRDLADIKFTDLATPEDGALLAVDANNYLVDSFSRTGSLWRLLLVRI